jgi:flagellar FliL protein
MSTAAAADAPAPAKSKKKLIIIIIIAVAALVLVGGGLAAVMMMKKKANAEAQEEGDAPAKSAAKAAPTFDPKAVPAFVPLDPFTVNLADRNAERYAQVGLTLEIVDAKIGEQIKVYMPAIRHNVLMTIADRTAGELMDRGGKAKLAEKIRRDVSRAIGYEIEADQETSEEASNEKPAKKKKKSEVELPVKAVHFSTFIIQ